MQRINPASVKQREIGFRDPHPDPQQAHTALLALAEVDGILNVSLCEHSHNTLQVEYDLARICLRRIEDLLEELGLHLDNSLLAKLKRALHHYTEENELQARSVQDDQDHNTREIFMRCYRCKTHGCRDGRPPHWRNYL